LEGEIKMKNRIWTLVLWSALVFGGSQITRAQELVIDNFSSGPTRAVLMNGARDLPGFGNSIIGGFRLIRFGAAPIAGGPARSTLLEIPTNTPPGMSGLFVESGVNSSVSVELVYGVGPRGSSNPLHLDLPGLGLDRFRIEFGACDLELHYLVQVFDSDNRHATHIGPISTANRNLPFTADFIFSDFMLDSGSINWNDIVSISIQLNTGNATGGQDFWVKRIIAAYGPPPPPPPPQ
jgi:hypothetical protein